MAADRGAPFGLSHWSAGVPARIFLPASGCILQRGMNSTICWMPVRDVADMSSGTFAVAPGTHKRGVLHDPELPRNRIPEGAIAADEWRSAAYRVGDVVIFRYDDTAHAALPNLSNEIRLSLDIRVGSANAPQPVSGTVEGVSGNAAHHPERRIKAGW